MPSSKLFCLTHLPRAHLLRVEIPRPPRRVQVQLLLLLLSGPSPLPVASERYAFVSVRSLMTQLMSVRYVITNELNHETHRFCESCFTAALARPPPSVAAAAAAASHRRCGCWRGLAPAALAARLQAACCCWGGRVEARAGAVVEGSNNPVMTRRPRPDQVRGIDHQFEQCLEGIESRA